jgi:hypothetical protein
MKKKVAKLQLNRETVRNLTEGDLKEAAGGASQTRCTLYDTCECSIPPTVINC